MGCGVVHQDVEYFPQKGERYLEAPMRQTAKEHGSLRFFGSDVIMLNIKRIGSVGKPALSCCFLETNSNSLYYKVHIFNRRRRN